MSDEHDTGDSRTRTIEYEHPGDVHELINEVGHVLLDELYEETDAKDVTVSVEVEDA